MSLSFRKSIRQSPWRGGSLVLAGLLVVGSGGSVAPTGWANASEPAALPELATPVAQAQSATPVAQAQSATPVAQAQLATPVAQRAKGLVEATSQRLKQRPDDQGARWQRAIAYDELRHWRAALDDYDLLIAPATTTANANEPVVPRHVLYQHRGLTRFRAGELTGSLEDFNQAIRLAPELEQKHWQRGLAQYILGRYEEGANQFALYQTYYGADVENVVWHMACLARRHDWQQAQNQMLQLDGVDRRPPLMTIDALFRGKATPQQVLKELEPMPHDSEAGQLAWFYGQLYLALYYDARGEFPARDLHLRQAVELKQDHYMWDVAHVWESHLRQKPVTAAP